MAKSAKDLLVEKIDADISKLRDMREYVLTATEDGAPAEKPKRGRGKNKPKPGLPNSTTDAVGF